ncbi:MAG TPA: NAD(P)-binding domain-containing protein [Chitinophaga sp.]
MNVGFIGQGNLGLAIAENLPDAGQPLFAYNRTAAKAAPLAEKGATVGASVAALAQQCEVVCTIVLDMRPCTGRNSRSADH